MNRPTLATRAYRQMARAAAAILDRHELVESVLVRRSVAAGEVSFGRSDIDLALVIGVEPADSGALLSLMNRFRALRAMFPLLGECQVYSDLDLRTWWTTDTYRASIDRRAAILLRGRPVIVPSIPVRREHAAYRCAFWLDGYLPTGFRKRNLTNLRKFAVEIWSAYATAVGIIAEPPIKRSDAEQLWRERSESHVSELRSDNPRRLLAVSFEVLKQLHAAMLAPCPPMRTPLVMRLRWPPDFKKRVVVIIPSGESEVPAEAREPEALLFTPEALQLYLEFVNPFAQWGLPRETGMGSVSPGAWLQACRNWGAAFRIRWPGFAGGGTGAAVGRIINACEALEFLRNGESPHAIGEDKVNRILATPRSAGRYYREVYPWVRDECDKLWAGLDGLDDSTNRTSAASSLSVMRSQS